MKTYYLQGMGRNPPQEVVDTVANFWKAYAKVEVKTPPMPQIYIATKQYLYDWIYALYLENWQMHPDKLLNVIIVIPPHCLGDFRTQLDAKGFKGYGIAVIEEQNILNTTKFLATHEFGHLLGLLRNGQGDHWFWPINCIMSWLPSFLVPLRWRRICKGCRMKLGG